MCVQACGLSVRVVGMCVHVHVCMHACVCVCVFVCVCVCGPVCMCVGDASTFVCVCLHMHAWPGV